MNTNTLTHMRQGSACDEVQNEKCAWLRYCLFCVGNFASICISGYWVTWRETDIGKASRYEFGGFTSTRCEPRFGQSKTDKRKLKFSGEDGTVSNCLDADLPEKVLMSMTILGRSRASAMKQFSDYTREAGGIFCNTGYLRGDKYAVLVVHLPYEADILASQKCRVRLEKLAY
ncbi:MAG: hypothetical protein V7775_03405 [Sulfitobacter sp.]